ncbi:MAG: carbon-nitrogen family hydrolase [Verrucomicrobiia bacterium]
MKVACCQLDIAWEDKPANYAKVRQIVGGAGLGPGTLLILPEMFSTGFSMNLAVTMEGKPSSTETFLANLAVEHEVCMVGGLAVAGADGRVRNQAVVFSPKGTLLARYSKIQPFTLGGEAEQYAAGTEIVDFDWQGCRVVPFVCYDLRFPELFRAAVKRGAQLFAVIANWPARRVDHWLTLLRARAIENQAYVVGVNRCGTDPKSSYPGRSVVIDPHGIIRLDLGQGEGVASIELDLASLEQWRAEFPALRDMRDLPLL